MSQLPSLLLALLLNNSFLTTSTFASFSSSQNTLKYRSELLHNVTGHFPNLDNILKNYFEVCPGQKECNHISSNVSNVHVINVAGSSEECRCSCTNDCTLNHNCCPGNVHGYLPYECVNVGIYPEKSGDNFLMINSCPSSYSDSSGTVEKCGMTKSRKDCPVTSFATGITYSSADCARCNGENNVTQWRVNITCSRNPPNLFKSADKFNAMLKKYDCQTFYWLKTDQLSKYRPIKCNANAGLTPKPSFNSCNITGFWVDYNEDVKWACENLNSHFYNFKNVFCFICNPSAASHYINTIIETCDMMGPLTNYENTLESLCQRQPLFKRLAPYKNIYCMLCNNRGFRLDQFKGYSVREDITALGLSNVQINVELHENDMLDIFDILNEIYNQTSMENYTSSETERVFYDKNKMKSLITSYVSACGDANICRKATEFKRYLPAPIPMCKQCECEPRCVDHENCCPDLILSSQPYTCITADKFLSIPHVHIRDMPETNASVQIIDRCVFRDSIHRNRCEINTNETAKIVSFVPIASRLSNFTFKNIFCFLCNHLGEQKHDSDINSMPNVISFNMTLYCNTLLEAYLLPDFHSLMDVSSKVCSVSFIPHNAHRCGGHSSENYVDNQPNIETFTRYPIQKNKTKHTYTRCNETGNWHRDIETIRHVCEGTTESLLTLPVYKYDYNVYKNFACFVCNPALPVSDLYNLTTNCQIKESREKVLQCTKRGADDLWFPYKNFFCADCNQPPIKPCILSQTGAGRYSTPKPPSPPPRKTTYERGLYSTAAPIINNKKGAGSSFRFLFSIHNDEWVAMESRIHGPGHNCQNGTWDAILKSCRQLYCDEGRFLENNTCHVISEVAANIAYVVKLKLAHVTETSKNSTSPQLHACGICNDVLRECTDNFDIETEFHVTSCNVSTNLTHHKDKIDIERNNSFIYVIFTLEIIATYHLTNVETELIGCLDKTYDFRLFDHTSRRVSFRSFHLTEMEEKNQKLNNVTCQVPNNTYTSLTGKPFEVNRLMLCPQVQLAHDEFEFSNETGSVFVRQNNLNRTEKEFRWHGTSVRICQYEQPVHVHHRPNHYLLPYYRLFSRISILLSLVGLLLTFITYCTFPILRTLPGKNIMVLTYNMFLAQACLEFAPELLFHQPYCTIAGAFLHYFWLSTFCAMQLCSYHMFKIFCLKFFQSHSFRFQGSQFLRYIAYVHGAPLAVVVFTIGVHMSLTKGTYTGYGFTKCFLSDIYSLVLAFLVPATVIFLMNIVFFVAVAQKIRSTPNLQRSTEKSDFLICVKICAIVGVSYPLQILDGIMPLSALSFIATALNGFQGVYIFIAYVCNRRVFGHYRSLCARCWAGKLKAGMSNSLTSESLPSPTSLTATSLQSLE